MLQPTLTVFNRSGTATNMLTVADYERFAKETNHPSWIDGAHTYAKSRGGCLVLMKDNSLLVFTVMKNGELRSTIYEPNKWAWEDET